MICARFGVMSHRFASTSRRSCETLRTVDFKLLFISSQPTQNSPTTTEVGISFSICLILCERKPRPNFTLQSSSRHRLCDGMQHRWFGGSNIGPAEVQCQTRRELLVYAVRTSWYPRTACLKISATQPTAAFCSVSATTSAEERQRRSTNG